MAHSTPACSTYHHYWNDRTGARLAATDSLGAGYTAIASQLTYTAAGQLYYAITTTPGAGGEYDYSWTWYDGAGSRVMAVQGHGDAPTPQDPHDYWSRRVYFVEDGPNVALQLGPDGVLERHVTAGLDAPVAVRRYSDAGPLLGTWTLVSDRQGTTLGALDSLGAQIAAAAAVSHNPFGAVEGLAPAGSEAPVSGYTGAAQSVSNGGGMVYLRNRWYDPQSGRFLTQDPIGLAGGVNLYAYAGNDPISFSDPFGLCPDPTDPWCKLAEGVARPTHALVRMEPAMLAVASLPTVGMGTGGGIAPEVARLANTLRTSTSGLLRAGGVATRLAEAVGGTVSALEKSEGYKVTVDGAKNIVARIKSTGEMRVSIDRLGSLTQEGVVSMSRGLTHLKNLSTDELVDLVGKAKDIVAGAKSAAP